MPEREIVPPLVSGQGGNHVILDFNAHTQVIVPINARLPVPFTTNDSEDAPDILANDMRKHGSDGRWSMRVAVLESAELVDGAKFDDAIRQKCHVVDVDAVAKCKADGKRFKMFMAVSGVVSPLFFRTSSIESVSSDALHRRRR